MKLRARFLLCALLFSIATAQERTPPRLLLSPETAWQKQSGEWTLQDGALTGTAGETLGEYAAARGLILRGKWLSFRATIEGPAAKAGVWFAGLRDSRDEPVRLSLDAATGGITNGRGRTVAALPDGAFEKPIELIMEFTADKAVLRHGGQQIAEFGIKFEEPEPTPSLFVERGKAVFSEIMLGTAQAATETPPPAPPQKPGRPAKPAPVKVAKAATLLELDFTAERMTALKSGWSEYFGVHFETAQGPWTTVRQFDGPMFGRTSRALEGGGGTFDGPFTGAPVSMALAWFRDAQRRDAAALDANLPRILGAKQQAVFIAPWTGALAKPQQDEVWALMKLIYSAPGADGNVFFQWGDDINSRHLGKGTTTRPVQIGPRLGSTAARSPNLADDARAYAEDYFAPAVEAVRRASADVFKDERQIPILIGSCARSGIQANRDWFRTMLEHELTGTAAPSLRGKRVIELADYLTVNYPFADVDDISGVQALWATYKDRVKGLWVTEEYGGNGRGAPTVLVRAGLFLEWAAVNDLNAQQTRLLWAVRPSERDDTLDTIRTLGSTMSGALGFAKSDHDGTTVMRISADEGRRLLVVVTPPRVRRNLALEFALQVGNERSAKPWVARVLGSGRGKLAAAAPTVIAKDGLLKLRLETLPYEPFALLVETP